MYIPKYPYTQKISSIFFESISGLIRLMLFSEPSVLKKAKSH